MPKSRTDTRLLLRAVICMAALICLALLVFLINRFPGEPIDRDCVYTTIGSPKSMIRACV